jgi:hypothetical protein
VERWPADVDGDVFRRLQESGFDFEAEHVVDFNIDVQDWPPAPALVGELKRRYPNVKQMPPDDESRGYIQIQLRSRVTYDFVMSIQREITALAHPFGGVCESWGVMQE